MAVRLRNDITHWVLFFLSAVEETALRGCQVFRAILDLQQKHQQFIIGLGKRAESGNKLLRLFYNKPVQTRQAIMDELNLSTASVGKLLKEFEEKEVFLD